MLELNKIYNKDCIQGMKDLDNGTISLILTDPPYEISRESNYASSPPTGRNTDRFRISIDFGDWDAQHSFDIDAMIKESYRCLKTGGYIVCFYDLWKIGRLKSIMEKVGFNQIRFIEWLKTNPVPINSKVNYLTNAREVAVCGVKGSNPRFNSEYDKGVYIFPIVHDKDRFHQTQKPTDLFRSLIQKHSKKRRYDIGLLYGQRHYCYCLYQGKTQLYWLRAQ